MDALTERDGHRESVSDTLFRAHADTVAHRHARSEVGVVQSFWSETLHECADDGVGARIPSGRDDGHGAGLLADLHERAAIVHDAGVDVEAVDGVDAQRQYLFGIFLAAACRGGEYGHVDVLQFGDVLDNVIVCQFGGLVLCSRTAHDAGYFKVFRGFQCLYGVASDVAVTDYGCSDFLHRYVLFIVSFLLMIARIIYYGQTVSGCKNTSLTRKS